MDPRIQTVLYIASAMIIFLLVVLTFHNRMIENSIMKGFWRADPEFCHTAGLEIFLLYLGNNTSYGLSHTRSGYFLAKIPEGLILNNSVNIRFTGGTNIFPTASHCKKYGMHIDWQDDESDPHDEEAFPSDLQANYYPHHHKLVLYSGDTVHAILYRDSKLSSMDSDDSLVPEETILTNPDDGEEI